MSPAPDHTRLALLIALVVVVLFLITGRAAAAETGQGWCWPLASPAATLLGFGDHYESGGQQRTHTGVDLAASEGDEVLAPVSATVSFVGEVPSGPDRRQKAVTIDAVSGEKLTLMPLDRVSVSRGDKVRPGETIARVGADGDGSSAQTHLHVSLRKGSLYLDPLASLVAPGAPAHQEPAADPQPAVDPQPDTQTAPDPRPSPVAAAVPQASPVDASAGAVAEGGSASPAENPAPSATGDVVAAPRTHGSVAAVTPAAHATTAHSVARPAAVAVAAAAAATGGVRAAAAGVSAAAGVASAATRDIVHSAAAADLTPRQVFSLADLARIARTRDRLVVTVVSYLLATIAASGLIAWAVKPREVEGLEPVPAVAHSD